MRALIVSSVLSDRDAGRNPPGMGIASRGQAGWLDARGNYVRMGPQQPVPIRLKRGCFDVELPLRSERRARFHGRQRTPTRGGPSTSLTQTQGAPIRNGGAAPLAIDTHASRLPENGPTSVTYKRPLRPRVLPALEQRSDYCEGPKVG